MVIACVLRKLLRIFPSVTEPNFQCKDDKTVNIPYCQNFVRKSLEVLKEKISCVVLYFVSILYNLLQGILTVDMNETVFLSNIAEIMQKGEIKESFFPPPSVKVCFLFLFLCHCCFFSRGNLVLDLS